jgi:uncharacterized DUF497 family protein
VAGPVAKDRGSVHSRLRASSFPVIAARLSLAVSVLGCSSPRAPRRRSHKHRVSFEEAATAFLDPLARIFDDPDDARGERRFILAGMSAMSRLVLVVHVERGERLRIISARLAAPRERSTLETEV